MTYTSLENVTILSPIFIQSGVSYWLWAERDKLVLPQNCSKQTTKDSFPQIWVWLGVRYKPVC